MENGTLRGWMEPVEPFLGPLHDVAKAFTGLTGVPVDLPAALFLRARLIGLPLPGRVSAGGSCHLLETADGWAAVNLARPDDLAAVPALVALLGEPGRRNRTRPRARRGGRRRGARAVARDRGRRPRFGPRHPRSRTCRARRGGEPTEPGWAADRRLLGPVGGPLCARLLGAAGAGREGGEHHQTGRRPPRIARLLPLAARRTREPGGRLRLRRARRGRRRGGRRHRGVAPRALRRLGIHAEEFLAARPGRVWLSITGYGRDEDRIAFGDDAAVAGALTGLDRAGDPVFLGDALADPVTGVFAAHAVARSLADGGGECSASPGRLCRRPRRQPLTC
ncbi:CoA transferase [Streptomyces mirabilis]|nr:CoA transferase [Streptomyces mirabilis]